MSRWRSGIALALTAGCLVAADEPSATPSVGEATRSFFVAMEDADAVPEALRITLDVGDENECEVGSGSWRRRHDEAIIQDLDVFEEGGGYGWSTSGSEPVVWAAGLSSRDVVTAEGVSAGMSRFMGPMSGHVTVTSVVRHRVAPAVREWLAYPFAFEAVCEHPFTVLSFRGGDDAVLLPDTTSGAGVDAPFVGATVNAEWTLQVPEGRVGHVLADAFASEVGVSEFWSPDETVTWTSVLSSGGFVSLEGAGGEYGVALDRVGQHAWAAMFSVADLDVTPHLRTDPVLRDPFGDDA